VTAATELKLPVLFTPGVNHTTVAEHVFGLLLAIFRGIVDEVNHTRAGKWKRLTGHEIAGKTIGIVGLGRIGKEVAIRARAFGMKVIAYDIYWDDAFAQAHEVKRCGDAETVLNNSDIVSLHTNLTAETRDLLDEVRLSKMKGGVVIINCARGELVNTAAMVAALESGHVGGYGTDVLDVEPPPADHPLLTAKNCIVTPHIGSRTYESVARQARMAAENLIRALNGEAPLAQANKF
jgi:D-3-phosphoglycerate dehydrogenase